MNLNRIFFFTKDEFACPELTRKYADKLWHFLGSTLLVLVLYLWFGWSWWVCGTVVLGLGIAWEIIVDCWILGKITVSLGRWEGNKYITPKLIKQGGISKYDLLADLLGTVLGVVIVWIGG